MPDGSVERKIFSEPSILKDEDLKHFKEFNDYIVTQNKPALDLSADPDRKWLRFLTVNRFDYAAAFN